MLMKNSTSPSTVNAIAGFADRAVSRSLKPDARKLYKRNILDSLGCAISALPGAPFAALREQFAEYRSGGSCTLIGGGKTAPDQAALYNSGLVRYVDLLDSYMSPGGLCHPSDNFGAILAALGPDAAAMVKAPAAKASCPICSERKPHDRKERVSS